jgi:hypothetical protein
LCQEEHVAVFVDDIFLTPLKFAASASILFNVQVMGKTRPKRYDPDVQLAGRKLCSHPASEKE